MYQTSGDDQCCEAKGTRVKQQRVIECGCGGGGHIVDKVIREGLLRR